MDSYVFFEEIEDLTLLELLSSDPELGKSEPRSNSALDDDSKGGNRLERLVNEDDEDPNIEELDE